jgi:hypothetical protein
MNELASKWACPCYYRFTEETYETLLAFGAFLLQTATAVSMASVALPILMGQLRVNLHSAHLLISFYEFLCVFSSAAL